MTEYDSRPDTIAHIKRVEALLLEIISELRLRALCHDLSKLQEPERSVFDRVGPPDMEYSKGKEITPEYQQSLDDLQDALAHHYAHNSHHPQHYENGIDGFTLLDLVEWFCDIKAAGERYKNGSLQASLEANKGRFHISDQLYSILDNTRKELGW